MIYETELMMFMSSNKPK